MRSLEAILWVTKKRRDGTLYDAYSIERVMVDIDQPLTEARFNQAINEGRAYRYDPKGEIHTITRADFQAPVGKEPPWISSPTVKEQISPGEGMTGHSNTTTIISLLTVIIGLIAIFSKAGATESSLLYYELQPQLLSRNSVSNGDRALYDKARKMRHDPSYVRGFCDAIQALNMHPDWPYETITFASGDQPIKFDCSKAQKRRSRRHDGSRR